MNKTTPEKYLKRFKEITESMYKITEAKNADYSWNKLAFKNFETIEILSDWIIPTADWIVVRITDKLTRIVNLLHAENKVADEKIADTLQDMANYAIILMIYLETLNKQTEYNNINDYKESDSEIVSLNIN